MNLIKQGKSNIANFDNAATELLECAVNANGRRLLTTQYQKTMFENYDVKIPCKPQKPKTEAFNV